MEKEALLIVDMSNDFVSDDGPLTVGKPAQKLCLIFRIWQQSF